MDSSSFSNFMLHNAYHGAIFLLLLSGTKNKLSSAILRRQSYFRSVLPQCMMLPKRKRPPAPVG